MPEITLQGLTGHLSAEEQNAVELLTHLPYNDFNRIKSILQLDVPGVLGPTTLDKFMDFAQQHKFDFSDAGVGKFKAKHNLGNTGVLAGVIGPQTAGFYFSEILESIEPKPKDVAPEHINAEGLALIKEFEGLARAIPGKPGFVKAYLDSVNVPTIGYGHTADVHLGQVISVKEAEDLLKADLAKFERGVQSIFDGVKLNENQFSALVSLCFNVGTGAVNQSSVATLIKAGDFNTAADRFLRFSFAGGKQLAGLLRRRQAERALFLKKV